MIETYVDFAYGDTLLNATTRVNEVVKMNEAAGWNMIQCQLITLEDKDLEKPFVYSMLYQRTKEVKARQQFEFGGEHAFKEQSAGEIPMGNESKTSEEV